MPESEEKEFNIGDARKSSKSRKRVLNEINKCQLVCANCHAMRSALRQTPKKVEAWLRSLEAGAEIPQEHCRGLDISDLDLVIIPPCRGTGLWVEASEKV